MRKYFLLYILSVFPFIFFPYSSFLYSSESNPLVKIENWEGSFSRATLEGRSLFLKFRCLNISSERLRELKWHINFFYKERLVRKTKYYKIGTLLPNKNKIIKAKLSFVPQFTSLELIIEGIYKKKKTFKNVFETTSINRCPSFKEEYVKGKAYVKIVYSESYFDPIRHVVKIWGKLKNIGEYRAKDIWIKGCIFNQDRKGKVIKIKDFKKKVSFLFLEPKQERRFKIYIKRIPYYTGYKIGVSYLSVFPSTSKTIALPEGENILEIEGDKIEGVWIKGVAIDNENNRIYVLVQNLSCRDIFTLQVKLYFYKKDKCIKVISLNKENISLPLQNFQVFRWKKSLPSYDTVEAEFEVSIIK